MSSRIQLITIWLVASTVALFVAFLWYPVVYVDGVWLPSGHDSFYHARRILDVVAEPGSWFEFDPLMHAPEGSWVTWPWAYDLGIAWLVRAVTAVFGSLSPLPVMLFIPSLWVFVNTGLWILIMRELRLPHMFVLAGALFHALSPLTQDLHGLGRIDHHYMEYTVVLIVMLLTLRWSVAFSSTSRAALAGAGLAAGVLVHNGMFILVLPVGVWMGWLWLRRIQLPAPSLLWFVATYLLVTCIALIPSQPFREGLFSYTLLSWFHAYVAVVFAIIVMLLSRIRPTPVNILLSVMLTLVLAVPLIGNIGQGSDFVFVRIDELKGMSETRSLFAAAVQGSISADEIRSFSPLLYLIPFVVIFSLLILGRSRQPEELFFAVYVLFGLSLLVVQFRFHHFGSFALLLPWLVLLAKSGYQQPRYLQPVVLILVVLALIPATQTLRRTKPPGFSLDYAMIAPIYAQMSEQCRREPGVVLADNNDGHYIRYHTQCGVISNNFIQTQQHVEKIQLTRALLRSDPEVISRRYPWIKYALVRRADNVLDKSLTADQIKDANPGIGQLLLSDQYAADNGVRVLSRIIFKDREHNAVLAAFVRLPTPMRE